MPSAQTAQWRTFLDYWKRWSCEETSSLLVSWMIRRTIARLDIFSHRSSLFEIVSTIGGSKGAHAKDLIVSACSLGL